MDNQWNRTRLLLASTVAALSWGISTGQAQPPTEGLVLWLDPDIGVEIASGAVERWRDQSSQGNDALQGTEAWRPLLVDGALNGHAVLRFDGADDRLGLTGTAVMNNMSLVIVQRLDGGATGNSYYPVTLGGNDNITGQYYGLETRNGVSGNSPDVVDVFAGFSNDARATYPGVAEYGTWRILSAVTEGFIANTTVRMNGAPAGVSTTGANVAMSVRLGNATGTGFGGVGGLGNGLGVAKCDVAEVLVYNRVLLASELNALEAYLSSKYAIQLIAPPEPVEGLSEGLVLWLDADAGVATVSGAVERWEDQGSQGNDALQGNTARRPLFVDGALNGHGILRFDGADDALGLTGTAVMNNMSLVIVQRLDAGATGNSYYPVTLGGTDNITGQYCGLETRNGSSGNSPDVVDVFAGFGNDARATYPGVAEYGTWRILSAVTEQFIANTTVRMNGALAGVSTTGANVAMSVRLGNATGTGFGGVGGLGNGLGVAKCDVAEVLVYNRVLLVSELNALDAYLSNKYAIQLIPPPEPVEGPFAMQFDGTDHVRIPHAPSIDYPNNSYATMELWAYFPIGDPALGHMLGKRPGCGGGDFYQFVRGSGDAGGGFASDSRRCGAGGLVEEGVWTHLAFVAYPDTAIFYVNGVRTMTNPCDDYFGTAADLLFGRSGSCGAPFVGMIDEVRFWNVARTGEEISEDYLCEVDPATPGLVGYWNFDEDQFDQNVLDLSPFGNHGTLGNHGGFESQDAVRVVSTLSLCPMDGTPPVIVCPSDMIVNCAPSAGIAVTFDVAATDDQDPAPEIVCSPPSGSLFPAGTTMVSCTATDAAGNSSSCGFAVIVHADTTPPTVSAPPDVVVTGSSGPFGCGATIPDTTLGGASVSDDCPGSITVVRTGVPSENFFAAGPTTITYTATDAAGNHASATQTVTVTVPPGAVAGAVLAGCPSLGTPLLGVRIDVFDTLGTAVATAVTDESGQYRIDGLPSPNAYTVTVVTPLGYQADNEDVHAVLSCGETASAGFAMDCVPIIANPRAQGFWKHQVGVATGGPGQAQVDAPTLCAHLDLIALHFNSNEVNQVVVYDPPASGLCADQLNVVKSLLNLRGSVGMTARAKQQLMALLLNVAAQYISLTQVVSADGATLSQAITYCDLLVDGDLSGHATAKTIAELINNNQIVPAGMIPLDIDDIAYRLGMSGGGEFELFQNRPNPFSPRTVIRFTLSSVAPYSLSIYNATGERVRRFEGVAGAGGMSLAWDASDENGVHVVPGVYFYRLEAEGRSQTRRMVLLK